MAVGRANDLTLRCCWRLIVVALAVSRCGAPEWRCGAMRVVSRRARDPSIGLLYTHSDRSMKAQRSILARRRVRFAVGWVRTDLHHLLL